ncbi:16S rRNA (adenine(1518)-N(6)/adenine(1519)-N(6))-dimethyltransferase RsmA [Candidatus Pelagibacter sp.]|nr:16S rRNA (adenine(1518)-N(6)/adenine(1519)-N(6))-dimethyltransferase RsmA [Candidatus Pelagibacter sp.]|tara:strand:+ start:594 stop:1382 length:789 start_codon:yes stop_codon:yes gene_type:complete
MKVIPKKSLGQNFLIDKNVIKLILNCAEIENQEVLEVGPGTGNLTAEILAKKPKKLFVIEKDNNLILILKKKLNNSIIYINDDILNISEEKLSENKLIVFGNLPYNISTEILIKWILNLKCNFWFSKLVLMFQKEVADRIISKSNQSNYGRLSVISNWKLNVKKIFDIKPCSFNPKPKVESSLLVFTPKEDYLKLKNSKTLEKITRIFFNQRRKKIKKPYNQLFKNNIEYAKKLNIDLDLRPQNLDNETYYLLAKEFENLRD